jgi:hypothetical protein
LVAAAFVTSVDPRLACGFTAALDLGSRTGFATALGFTSLVFAAFFFAVLFDVGEDLKVVVDGAVGVAVPLVVVRRLVVAFR